ncbi:MAG: hypothetical protein PHP17_00990 [Candidatus Omnitrophica bacterium]|nr:hypothetical protein [Candidatus Omnitrophota bacterium]
MTNFKKTINYRKIAPVLLTLCAFYFFISQFEAVSQNGKYTFSNEQRDPFSPLITESGQLLIKKVTGPAGFVLKGIIYSGDGSVAIIGDEVFKENDIINDYKVMKITRKKVLLKKGKTVIMLKLEETNENNSAKKE